MIEADTRNSNSFSSSPLPGIYFGKPRGFGTNEKGQDIGFNTEVYSTTEVIS